jgi:prepilin-type processing-associated H-X9-DG protein
MKTTRTSNSRRAFTVLELLVLVATLLILAGLLLPMLARSKGYSPRINCVNNLKQVGFSFRIWSGDNNDRFPMQVYTNELGAMLFADATNGYRYFQAMSNELYTPKVLVCRADSRYGCVATNFDSDLDNSKVSYFIGLDSDETKPLMFLAGDRNLTSNTPIQNGVMSLSSNAPVSWTEKLHNNNGNVALADGSVQQFTTRRLREALANTGTNVNRLLFP